MDYKEKYEKALERMKSWANGEHPECFSEAQKAAEFIFPELAESEDERVRKEIISYLTSKVPTSEETELLYFKRWIAWLEEQGKTFTKRDVDDAHLKGICDAKQELEKKGEQKPANIEPKFHKGDMIIHKELCGDYIHNPHKIIQVDILDKEYRLEGGLVAHFSEEDDYELVEQKPAWSEEDEDKLDLTISLLKEFREVFQKDAESCIDWLKSLKPQPHWKPTDEQMYALCQTSKNDYLMYNKTLKSLYNDLKKL